jgi:hypothetical protein
MAPCHNFVESLLCQLGAAATDRSHSRFGCARVGGSSCEKAAARPAGGGSPSSHTTKSVLFVTVRPASVTRRSRRR